MKVELKKILILYNEITYINKLVYFYSLLK